MRAPWLVWLAIGCGGAGATGVAGLETARAGGEVLDGAREPGPVCVERDVAGADVARRVHVAPDGRTVRFCLASCIEVDLASGTYAGWAPGEGPEAALELAPDARMDFVASPGTPEACTREPRPRCTALPAGTFGSTADSVALVAGVVVVARHTVDETYATSWTIGGHAEGSGERLYARSVEDGGVSYVRAVGPYALFHGLASGVAFLFDPRTGAVVHALGRLGSEAVVVRARPDRFVVTDAFADDIDVVTVGSGVRHADLVAPGVGTSIAIHDDLLIAVAGVDVAGDRDHVGEVVVVDLDTGAVLARHRPVVCGPNTGATVRP